MKKHTTVTITSKMLHKLGACEEGAARNLRFLPATISTDPEKNLELAARLVEDRLEDDDEDQAYWLVNHVDGKHRPRSTLPDSLWGGQFWETQHDVFVTAQYLAWAADVLATRDGR